jgi:hypothetical protein
MNYLIHDNRDRPFTVNIETVINWKNKKEVSTNVRIYRNKEIHDHEDDFFVTTIDHMIMKFKNIHRLFIGKSVCSSFTDWCGPEVDGNTILVQPTTKNEYIWVGNNGIMLFKPTETIEHYMSPIGNNDVPYPYAISKNNIYLLLEDAIISKKLFKKELLAKFIDGTECPYDYFYNEDPEHKKFQMKELFKRQFL